MIDIVQFKRPVIEIPNSSLVIPPELVLRWDGPEECVIRDTPQYFLPDGVNEIAVFAISALMITAIYQRIVS